MENMGGIEAPKESDYCTVQAAARRLGVSLNWVRSLIYAGRLPAELVAGRWQIARKDVIARAELREEFLRTRKNI